MVPTSLPELSKPSRTSGENQKTLVLATDLFYTNLGNKSLNSLFIHLKGPIFGHNSESSGAFLTKIGGNDSYRPPGPF